MGAGPGRARPPDGRQGKTERAASVTPGVAARPPRHAWGRAATVVALGFALAFLGVMAVAAAWWLSFLPFGSEVVVLALWRRWRVPAADLLAVALAAGIGVAFFSLLTGFENGLTDEPWAFPLEQAMLFHGIDPYAVAHTAVNPYSGRGTSGRLWELPLTVVLLVPRVPYGYQMLGCWAVLVLRLRGREAGVLLAQPFVALLAANGFSDFLPLLLLTWAYVGRHGPERRWAEVLALGIKQFANALIVFRYAWRRDGRGVVRVLAITAAWILPFVLWNPGAFVCGAVVFDVPAACPANANLAGPHSFNPLSLNYWLWPLWLLSVGWAELPAPVRRGFARWSRRGTELAPAPGRDEPGV